MRPPTSPSHATRRRGEGLGRIGELVERFAVRFAEAALLAGVIGAAVAILARA